MTERFTPPSFVVLTGFLGSGKTTLLRDFLDLPEAADTAFIVNEAGEIGLDGAVLAEGGGDVRMAMLSNGCVCCQGGSDLAATVEALLAADRPGAQGPLRRIILETSGLAKPGPILRSLAVLAEHRMPISIVATYDVMRGPDLAEFPEALAQWAGAQAIVLTKTDLVSAERLGHAAQEASAFNPLAAIVSEPDRRLVFPAALEAAAANPPSLYAPEGEMPGAIGHPRINVLLAAFDGKPFYDDLATWLDNLTGLLGDRLLRLKGLVRIIESDAPLLVQSVGTLFSIPRPFRGQEIEKRSFLVIIARDTSIDEIQSVQPRLNIVVTGLDKARSFSAARSRSTPMMAERVVSAES